MSKLRILMCADDPHTILSYGLLSKMIIDHIYKYYDIHYLSLQRQIGEPLPIKDDKGNIKYIKYPSHNKGERNPANLPNVINRIKPNVVWTNFDVQVYEQFIKENYIPKGLPWIGWIPWDNHDVDQIPRAQQGFKNVDARIAISQFGFKFLTSHGVRMDGYIYNIVDTNIFNPLPKDNKELLKFKKGKNWINEKNKILLFVGRPNWRKRMVHMFAIMKELLKRGRDDIKLFIHSNLHDPSRDSNLPEVIDAFGLADTIIPSHFYWDRGVPKEKLNLLYNIADLYIAPHGGEGFGMPIGEAMATGTPFVASDICTTPEFAGDNERGFKAPVYYPKLPDGRFVQDRGVIRPYPDVVKFADLIEKALEDEDRLKKMGENGVEWVRKFCSPEAVAKAWRDVFDRFIVPIAEVKGFA